MRKEGNEGKRKKGIDEDSRLFCTERDCQWVVRLSRHCGHRDSRFVSRFWKTLHESMGTKLQFSKMYHPQTDGRSEKTIQTLEDMLRACVLYFKTRWNESLPLCEFAYKNNYHSSIGMAPFEALYGTRCKTPFFWYLNDHYIV